MPETEPELEAERARVERRADGVWVLPAPSNGPAPLRVVGPGRRERAWRTREALLEQRLERLVRELDTARLVERGSARLVDRIEAERERERAEQASLRQSQARLVLMLGALQRENAALRRELALAGGAARAPKALGSGLERASARTERGSTDAERASRAEPPRSLWRRVFGRGSPSRSTRRAR